MSNIPFAWDSRKASGNLAKHGVFFAEAQSVFLDGEVRLIDDPDHSESERRLLMSGYSLQARCPIVSHYYREDDSVIRLISARKPTATEMGMPYQNLINLFLRDCATKEKRPMLEWVSRQKKK